MSGSTEQQSILTDYLNVISGNADEATRHRVRAELKKESSELKCFLDDLQSSSSSPLGNALAAAEKKRKAELSLDRTVVSRSQEQLQDSRIEKNGSKYRSKRTRWFLPASVTAVAAAIAFLFIYPVVFAQANGTVVVDEEKAALVDVVVLVSKSDGRKIQLPRGASSRSVPAGTYTIDARLNPNLDDDIKLNIFIADEIQVTAGETVQIPIGGQFERLSRSPEQFGDGTGLIADVFDGYDPVRERIAQRRDATIDFLWFQSPMFPHTEKKKSVSIRWIGYLVPPEAGEYTIIAATDDGATVTLGDKKIIDAWKPTSLIASTATVTLEAKPIFIQVDYHNVDGAAFALLRWIRPDGVEETIPASCFAHDLKVAESMPQTNEVSVPVAWGTLRQEFFSGEFDGEPIETRTVQSVDLYCGREPVSETVGKDNFSVRWSGTITVDAEGSYELTATVNDNVRVRVGGETIIEQWDGGNGSVEQAKVFLTKGEHEIEVEYRELEDDAFCFLRWSTVN